MIKTIAKIACAALLVSGAAACKKDKKAKTDKAEKAEKTTEKVEKTPAEEKPKLDTPEDKVAFYRACFGHVNAKDWDKFGTCYTDGAVSEQVDSGMPAASGRAAIIDNIKMFAAAFPDFNATPTLILTNGNKVASVMTFTGTHTGPLKGPMGEIPATSKKVGIVELHMIEIDPAGGGASKEWIFTDMGTMMGQLGLSPAPTRPVAEAPTGEPTIVIAKNDDAEKANLELHKKSVEAWNKRDMKTVSSLMADDAVSHDMASPKDLTKKDADKMGADIVKAFPDAKGEVVDSWAAGDYVVAVAKNSGTNKGAFPMMGIKKATGKSMSFTSGDVIRVANGKAAEGWMFYNSMAIAQQLGLLPPAGAAGGGDKAPEGGDKAAPEGDKGAEKKPAEGEKKMDEKKPAAEGGAGGN